MLEMAADLVGDENTSDSEKRKGICEPKDSKKKRVAFKDPCRELEGEERKLSESTEDVVNGSNKTDAAKKHDSEPENIVEREVTCLSTENNDGDKCDGGGPCVTFSCKCIDCSGNIKFIRLRGKVYL